MATTSHMCHAGWKGTCSGVENVRDRGALCVSVPAGSFPPGAPVQRAIRKPGEVMHSRNITMWTAQLSVFLITFTYPKRSGDAAPHTSRTSYRACKNWVEDGTKLLRQRGPACFKSVPEHWCLHSHCCKGWQCFLIPCKIRQLWLLFCVIPGLTISQVQPHPAVRRKGGAEGVCHRPLHFLPSSIRKQLSALLSVFLLSCLASEWFTPHGPFPFPLQLCLWMLVMCRLRWVLWDFRDGDSLPHKHPGTSQSYYLREPQGPRWGCPYHNKKICTLHTNATPGQLVGSSNTKLTGF